MGLWFAGFVGIAAIWFGTHDASEQRGVTQGQLNVMQSEFTATQRPWISVDSMKISSPLFFNANGDITLSVHFSLTNSGRTPGIFVYPNVTFVLMTMTTGQLSTIIGKTREHCESKRLGKFSPMESGILVPPGKNITHPFHFGITITSDDIKRGKDVVRGREAILPYIGGCINYQFTFGERQRHQTGFVYELLGPDTFIFWIVATSRSINSPSSNRMAVGPIKRVRNRYGGARRLLT